MHVNRPSWRRSALLLAAGLTLGLSACAPRPGETATTGEKAGETKVAANDDNNPGHAVYLNSCASCHDNGATSGAPSLEALRTLNKATIRYALELGYMQQQAKNLTADERTQVIDWLPRNDGNNDDWVKTAACQIKLRKVNLDPKDSPRTSVAFGITPDNNRHFTADRAGLSTADMKNLQVSWVIAFPQTPTMRSQPVIVGDTLFIAATDAGRIYALDTDTGCIKWVYASDMTLRSSLAFAEATEKSPTMIVAGDAAGRVQAVNALTGKKEWVTDVKLTSLNRITGAPMVSGGVVYAPISVIESNFPPDDDYQCCKGQGAIAALDLATGKKLWTGRTIDEDAKPTRIGRSGTQQYGPAGAMMWSTPVVDAKRRLLYTGTGESLSWPATNTSDSIIAFDMDTGQKRWVFQATKQDIWNSACGRRGANCDWPGEYWSPDFDFGATSMLVKRQDGSELVIAGQKSGALWALEPDTGKLVWSNKIGRGSAQGGIHWGMAYDGTRIFAPLNDGAPSPDNPNWGPGIHAVNAMTGEIEWSYKPNARDCGQDAPVSLATHPTPEWRITPISAPMPPPPRPTTPPAPRTPPAGIARAPAAAPAAVPAPGQPAAAPAALAGPPRPNGEGATLQPTATATAGGDSGPPRPPRCRLGMSAAPLLVDGAVVTGTLQGMLRIFDAKTGEVLFEYMTNKAFPETTSGLPGHGGALDSAPYTAGDGKLFVQSGYARFGEPPGNVLIAFKPKGKR
ncbi:MAG TPA: PQQ-binding-like beta-propeller repeat protein [Hyphomonadaceae bacterium]|nr:PQQ-binding-like beta-propeller repeat protein [Hyphomonadaceae bacterium]